MLALAAAVSVAAQPGRGAGEAMSRSIRLALLLIVLSGYGLRVWPRFPGVSRDEAFGYFFGQSPYAQIVADTLSLREPHPVASYFVQKAWLGVTGDSEFALALCERVVLCSGDRVAGVGLGKRSGLPDGVAALSGAAGDQSLCDLAPQDARMYSMSLALTLASSLAALGWLRRNAARGAGCAASSSALHTHYFAVFVLVAQNAYVAVQAITHKADLRKLVRWLGLQVAVAACMRRGCSWHGVC